MQEYGQIIIMSALRFSPFQSFHYLSITWQSMALIQSKNILIILEFTIEGNKKRTS